MDRETFKEQIENELQKMSREKILFFAWLCAVRALPFIGARGHFAYLSTADKQKHLYALFRVLDLNYAAAATRAEVAAARAVANAAPYDHAANATANTVAYAAEAAEAAKFANANETSMQNILWEDIKKIQKKDKTFNRYVP